MAAKSYMNIIKQKIKQQSYASRKKHKTTYVPRILTYVSVCWLSLLIICEFIIAEHNRFTAAITYVPQQAFMIPFIIALLCSLYFRQMKFSAINIVTLITFILVFLGLNLHFPTGHKPDFKVMTLNIAQSAYDITPVTNLVVKEKPDILLLQEINPLRDHSDAMKNIITASDYDGVKWYSTRIADTAILSVKPLTNIRSYPLLAGSGRRLLVAETEVGGRQVSIACIHFATNVPGDPSMEIGTHLAGSAESRMAQADVVDTELPVQTAIVAGDFNLPPRGLAYRKITRKYRNSFSAANGFGYTFPAKMPLMRIDHILLSRDLSPVRWRAVDTGSSDHLAVIADISYKN